MRFVSVTARAFGALRDATLELAPGFNVIYGANGAGKSTWHAALYAALCGMRRGPGRRREDRDFAAEWSPRTGSEWLVRARIVLADGRTIELRQDLEHLVDCRATDVDLARDVSSEIMNENTPDGARWLGLDRQAFLATACVRQADLLVVLDDASRLQEHLQRAAASAGRDETAAAALQRIEQFQREHVGLDRANSTRPLRRAKEREQAARAAFDQAAEAQGGYLQLTADVESASRRAAELARELAAARAAVAMVEAATLRRHWERAAELAARFADGPPRELARDEELARDVTAGLATWERRAPAPQLTGPTAQKLREELEAIPLAPEGDLMPHAQVVAVGRACRDAQRSVELHRAQRPEPAALDGGTAPAARPSRPARLVPGLALAALGLAGISLAREWLVPAALVAAAGLALLLWRMLALGREANGSAEAAFQLGLRRWQRRQRELELAESERGERLAAVLSERGGPVDDPLEALQTYERECAERAQQAGRAARRPDLESRIAARMDAEQRALEVEATLRDSTRRLHAAAAAAGVEGEDEEALVHALCEWETRRVASRKELVAARDEYAELRSLLKGRALEGLEDEFRERDAEARRLRTQAGDVRTEGGAVDSVLLEREASDAARHAALLRGQLQERERDLPGVPEAEEALADAIEERERVERLASTLERTRAFLERAQERVHRDVAPRLADTLREWLPAVTEGRYAEASVDPQSLEVRVRDASGELLAVPHLSHGTREQVYLLLRVALADHLTAPHEVCPLLLDDVTVQSDAARTVAILDLLQQLSRERQIILFSQEEEALIWAREHLEADCDRLQRL